MAPVVIRCWERLAVPSLTALFDPSTGIIKPADPELADRWVGAYTEFTPTPLVLFRDTDDRLKIYVDGKTILFDDLLLVELGPTLDQTDELALGLKDGSMIRIQYRLPSKYIVGDDDPTPMVSQDDFDLCLFIQTLFEDPDQRERMFRPLEDNL